MKRIYMLVLALIFLTGQPIYCAQKLPAHPRLLMKAGDEQVIRMALETEGKEYVRVVHDLIMEYADSTLRLPCMERTDTDGHILARCREVEKRILCLSYAYRMTGDKKWLHRAESEILNGCNYRDWDPAHWLDTAEMMIALTIGYDWLYNDLSPKTRRLVEKSLVEKGMETAEGQAFYTVNHNWNQVCNCAMVMSSLAIYETDPSQMDRYIRRSLESNPRAMSVYAPDGAYPEGNTYWGYGTSYQILMIEALRTALGTDYGIPQSEGFLKSGNYIKYLATPAGRCFSFYDSNTSQICHLMTFWFSKETGDPSLCHLEKQMLLSGKVVTPDRWWPCAVQLLSRVDEEGEGFCPRNTMYAGGINPIWVYRSGWDSPDDTYLAVKGGNPCNNHGHVDNGSFFYEKYGVLWAADLGMQSYGTFYKYGIALGDRSQNGQRWSIFRVGKYAHNILILNDENPYVNGFAPIVESWDDVGSRGCRVDLTETYRNSAASVSRTVVSEDADAKVVVKDSIAAGAEDIDAVWNMLTYGKPEIKGDSEIILTSGKRKMRLKAACGVPVHAFIRFAGADTPWDAKNKGVSRVGFSFDVRHDSQVDLTVTLEDLSSGSSL
ncbi:MAG: heparinase II/III family protein [Bacteroidales bacterium]|nr:heparinase II/III family protein [Bacteroidales bacterium]